MGLAVLGVGTLYFALMAAWISRRHTRDDLARSRSLRGYQVFAPLAALMGIIFLIAVLMRLLG